MRHGSGVQFPRDPVAVSGERRLILPLRFCGKARRRIISRKPEYLAHKGFRIGRYER